MLKEVSWQNDRVEQKGDSRPIRPSDDFLVLRDGLASAQGTECSQIVACEFVSVAAQHMNLVRLQKVLIGLTDLPVYSPDLTRCSISKYQARLFALHEIDAAG